LGCARPSLAGIFFVPLALSRKQLNKEKTSAGLDPTQDLAMMNLASCGF
jgi:hypothetical protein